MNDAPLIWSAAPIALTIVLAICFVALVGLVVTLPGVRNLFRRAPKAPAANVRARTV